MIEELLQEIARRILALDEETLISLVPTYRKRMDNFEPTREWEESVIIYFLINGYRVKNAQFNEKIKHYIEELKKKDPNADDWVAIRPDLRLIK
ncbi:MAG: hypothetical protein LBE31_08985 [Deltaproteobacteria bacterium]|jgi:hypothetical protein|nr:hypothetical protein [Deltaproteobacteria bacterium]